MPPDYPRRREEPEYSEVPWEELVEWAESDLRRQLARRLGPGNQVTPSSVIGSMFRRAASRPGSLPLRFRDACNWLFGIAGRVASEKNRNARAWKRRPRNGTVFPVGEQGEFLADPQDPAERQQFEDALQELPKDHAALLRAVYFEGLSLQEFAESKGMSPRAASRAHLRALSELKRLIPPD